MSYIKYYFTFAKCWNLCVKLSGLKIHKKPPVNNTSTPTNSAV